MKRVMIIGGSGCGKSTTARRLAEITGLPVIHIDPMYYSAGWQLRGPAETNALALEAAAKETWIIDGNHNRSIPERLSRADTLIFLDISTPRRMWRILSRTLKHYGQSRPDMAKGCPERFEWEFTIWVAKYYWQRRDRDITTINTAPAHVKCYYIKNSADLAGMYKDAQNDKT